MPNVLARVLLIAALVGCAKKPPVAAPVAALAQDALVVAVRERPVPDPAQVRFTIKMHSEPLGIVAPPLNGGLVVDRPGRAFFTILNPVGGPVLTVVSDGVGVTFINVHDRQVVRAADATALLDTATKGVFSLDDLVGLLIGLMPFDPAAVRAKETTADGVRFVVDLPGGTHLTADVDPVQATPRRVQLDDAQGATVVTAVYDAFEDVGGRWMPTHVAIEVLPVGLTLDLRYRGWLTPETAPDVFHAETPDSYEELTFEEYAARMKDRLPKP